MLEPWQGQPADWRLSFEFECGENGKLLAVRPGQEAQTLIVGLGPRAELTAELARRAAAKAVKALRDYHAGSALLDAAAVLHALGESGLTPLAQGAELAAFEPRSWKSGKTTPPVRLYCGGADFSSAKQQLTAAGVLVGAVCFARDLVNEPANFLTPDAMARRMADAAGRVGVESEILDENQIRDLGMSAFLTVGGGAAHPPRLIVLRYRGGRPEDAPIALVGKGITCDTGGYCLKSSGSMKGIKGDMAGGAAVCGALLALAENKIPINAVAIIPAAENRISPDSFIPGDIIGSMAGKTIEIGNTDAEGRLILADAVTYAIRKEGASRLVDICTLTGAVVGMFGFTTAGLLTNDEVFYSHFTAATAVSGEQYWRLPTFPEYEKMLETPLADLSNTSNDGCGTITAGLFIAAFHEGKPWIHLDIAGTAWVDTPKWEYQSKGATGAGVVTLYELCRVLAEG